MLVNLEPFGRLGNRLFLGAHLIAFSLKHDFPLLNLGFGEYANLFPWLEGNAAFAYPWKETGTIRDAQKMARGFQWQELLPWSRKFGYWGNEDWNFDQREPLELTNPLRKGQTVLFRSWLFRGPDSVMQYRKEILSVFEPPLDLAQQVEDQINSWRVGGPTLVGVHVRWEDYRGSKHFLDQQGFVAWMRQVRAVWPERSVRFVLFSNETLPETGWDGLDWVRSPGQSPLYDLTAMAKCDYLIGPPSTFSGWASFSRCVPLLTLGQEMKSIKHSDFAILTG